MIKRLSSRATDDQRALFITEAHNMSSIDSFCIVSLLGYVLASQPNVMVLEYMPRGNLRDYLRTVCI